MAENEWYEKNLDDFRQKLNQALGSMTPEQRIGANMIMPILHGLYGVIEALREDQRRIIKQAPVVCAFCSHEERTLDGARKHIETCEKHPMYGFRENFSKK